MNRRLTPFGKCVKKRIIDKNMSQRELAEKIGVSSAYLNNVLHGERSGAKYISEICKVLEMEKA